MRGHAAWCAAIGVFASALLTGVLSAGTLEVRVLEDHTGNPLANAEVSVARVGAANLAADLETDKSGLMRVEGLAAGDYDLEVSKPLYVTVKAKVQVADDTTALTVRLVRYAIVSGRVTGASGGPARNAVVRVLERSGVDGPLKPLGGGQAVDENGEYRIFNLQPGQYAFAVSYGADRSSIAPKADELGIQYYPGNANPQLFTVTGGEEFRGIDFYFGAGQVYRVSGKVEYLDRVTSVQLNLAPSSQPELPAGRGTVDRSDGTFRFEGVPSGSYDVYAAVYQEGAAPFFGKTHIEIGAENLNGVVVRAQERRALKLTLRAEKDAGGCPTKTRVTLRPVEDWGVSTERSLDLAAGRELTVENLAPGRYRVDPVVLNDTCSTTAAEVDLATADEAPLLAVSIKKVERPGRRTLAGPLIIGIPTRATGGRELAGDA